ncbi:hypothetical protein CKA32_002962 [Geitlerinema sp. FC II]|nr:hypothetical protein CKA32_002962 [Geitlerinema sp. FC II]
MSKDLTQLQINQFRGLQNLTLENLGFKAYKAQVIERLKNVV